MTSGVETVRAYYTQRIVHLHSQSYGKGCQSAEGNAERKGKEGKQEYLYSAFLAKEVHSKRSDMDHTFLPANNTMPAFPS